MRIEPLLEVTRRLAAPFDLRTMLEEVVEAATQVLQAERGSVWLHDRAADELVLHVSTDLAAVRVPADSGLVGACARSRQPINVPDCYADPRFNPELDRRSGFRTRCMLALPLIGHRDDLVGVLQVMNKVGGVFEADDQALAAALAAQCAVALQRARMTEELIETEKMRRELEMAREVQQGSLPSQMPSIPGYEVWGCSRPADLTGGDTFDVAPAGSRFLLVLGDATGHGLAPALHVTQMHAMLRFALRLGTGLDDMLLHLNNQLASDLPDDRFITAFIGLLDPASHRLEFHSAGQAPILLRRAATGDWRTERPTTFPLAAMPARAVRPSAALDLEPGDLLALVSDGVFEYRDAEGRMYGPSQTCAVLGRDPFSPLAALGEALWQDVQRHAAGAPQDDDITVVLLRRGWPQAVHTFERSIHSLTEVFAFIDSTSRAQHLRPELRRDLNLAVEELFTNMVKYGGSEEPVELRLRYAEVAVEAELVDRGVDRFDPREAPAPDLDLPLEERQPGGLGLHLVQKIVDVLEYRYDPAVRTGCTRVLITLAAAQRARS